MESLLVVLCVCLAGQVLALPQAVDSDTILPTRRISAEQTLRKEQVVKELQGSQLLKRSPAADGDVVPSDLANPKLLEGSSMKTVEGKELVNEQSQMVESKPQPNTLSPTGQTMADAEDSVRKKKSTSIQEVPHTHGPHTTTVCIQVRSDHQPRVVCGDPLSDSRKEGDQSVISPPKARVAFRSPNDYYPHTYEQQMPYMPSHIQPNILRVSQQNMPEMMPGRPYPGNQIPLGPTKSPVMHQGSIPMSPKAAARGPLPVSMYPLKRSEEEPGPKIGDATIPQGQPTLLPGLPPNRPIIVHKQYYQPASPYHLSNVIPGPPSPLRLNCATEGGFIPYLRSGQPDGYIPIEERLMVNPMAARMAETPEYMADQQAYFYDPEARQDISDNIVGAPYLPDGMSGTLYVDEDGQAYVMHGTEGRSAVSDQFLGDEIKEDLGEKTRRQEKALQQSNEKLEELKKEIKTIQMKVAGEVEKKEDKKDITEMKKDTTSELTTDSPVKKMDSPKNTKRNIFRLMNR